MITLFGRATSSNVQIAAWALHELNLDHRRLDVGGSFGGTDTPDFRAMNPNGLVPVLRDGDLAMFESAAILRYLGAAYGDDAFWPKDPKARAALDQWAEWSKTTFTAAMTPLFMGTIRTPPSKQDPAAITRAAEAIRPVAKMLDARIGAGPWLAGDDFTFADVAFGPQLYRYFTLPFDRADTPALSAWYDRMQARPDYRDHAAVSYEPLRVSA